MSPRTAPYKDFLQPALQRRFSSTATVLLVIAYVQALLLSSWSSFFWAWFPIGPTGIRSLVIFACGLAILVLRIAHYHVGVRTSQSPIHTLLKCMLHPQTLETFFWYALSSVLFCIVYFASPASSVSMSWVSYHAGDRARLNERPLFVLCYALIGAVVQTVIHRAHDTDRLDLDQLLEQDRRADTMQSLRLVTMRLPKAAVGAVIRNVLLALLSTPIYLLFVRTRARNWALFFLRPFFSLPRTNALPQSHPADGLTLIACICAGTLCTFMWTVANDAFALFMAKEPLKNDRPLTSDSKDPNGSLLNGLKSKRLAIQCFAMWELAYIAERLPERRTAIYNDIDRREGPMWTQMFTICMDVIKTIDSRIDYYSKLSPAPAPSPSLPVPSNEELTTRPTAAPNGDAIPPSQQVKIAVGSYLGQVMRSPGRSPLSQLSPKAKRTFRVARDQLLTKEQQKTLAPKHLMDRAKQIVLRLVNYPWIAALFRVSFGARLTPLLLGSPHAEKRLYIDAVTAISELAAHSLDEDQFGNVHRDVAAIIRGFTSLIGKAESLQRSFPSHWTDVSGSRDAPEVEDVVHALKIGLETVLEHFEPYRAELRLTAVEMRTAKEAAKMTISSEVEGGGALRATQEVRERMGKRMGKGRGPEKEKEKRGQKKKEREKENGKGKERERADGEAQNATGGKDTVRQRGVNALAETTLLPPSEEANVGRSERRKGKKEIVMPEMRQMRPDRPW